MGAKPLTSSTACVFYHRFYSEEGVDNSEYDEFVSRTCIVIVLLWALP